MGELDSHYERSIIDVTQMSLSQLTTLDDTALEASVGQMLRTCASAGDRHWDFGKRRLGA